VNLLKVPRQEAKMQDMNSLTHSVWTCKYHVVWIPKYRRKNLYGDIAKYLGETFHELARQRESRIVEGHICADHIHMLIEIPPKYSVAQVVGYIKGKSAIHIARTYMGRKQNFTGENFWAKGYYVSTVGRDEESIKKYIREQEVEDKRLDQLELFKDN
jgi:putative transposase